MIFFTCLFLYVPIINLISNSDNVKFILIQSDSSDIPSILSAWWNLSSFLICSNKDWLYSIPDVYFFFWDLSLPSLLPGESLYCSWVGALISCILFLLPYWFILIFDGASSNFFIRDSYGIHFVRVFLCLKITSHLFNSLARYRIVDLKVFSIRNLKTFPTVF